MSLVKIVDWSVEIPRLKDFGKDPVTFIHTFPIEFDGRLSIWNVRCIFQHDNTGEESSLFVFVSFLSLSLILFHSQLIPKIRTSFPCISTSLLDPLSASAIFLAKSISRSSIINQQIYCCLAPNCSNAKSRSTLLRLDMKSSSPIQISTNSFQNVTIKQFVFTSRFDSLSIIITGV